MSFGTDQQMDLGLGAVIFEYQHPVVFKDDIGRSFFIHNPAEYAIGHFLTFPLSFQIPEYMPNGDNVKWFRQFQGQKNDAGTTYILRFGAGFGTIIC